MMLPHAMTSEVEVARPTQRVQKLSPITSNLKAVSLRLALNILVHKISFNTSRPSNHATERIPQTRRQ